MDITITHPELMSQWDYDKNKIDPIGITAGSHKKVWWKCPVAADHCWEATIQNRAKRGTTCPCCCNRKCVPSNCLSATHPEIIKEWSDRNEINSESITQGYSKKSWWKCCKCNQEWQTNVIARTRRGDGCPYCYNKASPDRNLVTLFPEILEEWDNEKNKVKPTEILPNSMKKIWWKCSVSSEHRWQATPNNRTSKKHKCPYCSGKKADSTTSLLAKYPKLCEEWDYKRNFVKPEELMPQSHKKIWWICNKDETHRWSAKPNARIGSNSNCPYCNSPAGEKLIKNYLIELGASFSREHRMSDCRNKKPLPFDFAVHLLKLGLIEFQGRQHYKAIDMYGGEEGYKQQKMRDKIKKDFCKDNDIPFLEIRYDQTAKIPRMISDFIERLK